MAFKSILKKAVFPPATTCTGTVIFLHGSGGTGVIAKQYIKFALGEELQFPHLQIVYPTAPIMCYSLNDGLPQNVWFDRLALEQSTPEHNDSIDEMAETLNKLIDEEVKAGIPVKRIVVGGFSMGGSMSLHMGLRFRRDLGGIFSLSSYLSEDSIVFESIENRTGLPPLFMAHGEDDDVIPFDWGKHTYERLRETCTNSVFHTFPNGSHEVNKKEILLLREWISQQIVFNELP